MDKKALLITFAAIILSFVGGFFLANSLNRKEINSLRSENERLSTANRESGENELSAAEIENKIEEADRKPSDFQYQKNLGTALYQYATIKHDSDLLEKSVRLLERASNLNREDRLTLVNLGNAYFDLAYSEKQNEDYAKARDAYRQALEIKPDDADVRTDYGLTFYLQDPPDIESAIVQFKRSLSIDPNQEKATQFIIQAFVKLNKPEDAREYLERLKAAKPTEESTKELAKLVEAAEQKPPNK